MSSNCTTKEEEEEEEEEEAQSVESICKIFDLPPQFQSFKKGLKFSINSV